MSSNVSLFREAFRGYQKDDVNTYIANQNEKFSDMEADYKKEISDLRLQINDLNQKKELEIAQKIAEHDAPAIKVLEAQIAEAKEKEIALDREKENLRQELTFAQKALEAQQTKAKNEKESSEYEQEISNLQLQLEKANALIVSMREENEQINHKYNELLHSSESSDDTAADKVKVYDQLSQQIGSLMLDARLTADDTVKKAQTLAAELLAKATMDADETKRLAEEYALSVRNTADETYAHVCEYIKDVLKKLSTDCLSNYTQRLEHCKSSLDAVTSELRTAGDQLSIKMESMLASRINDINAQIDAISPKQ